MVIPMDRAQYLELAKHIVRHEKDRHKALRKVLICAKNFNRVLQKQKLP